MNDRMSQINELIKQNLSVSIHQILLDFVVSVTEVEVSRDLSYAKVWIATLTDPDKALLICNANKKFLQHEIAKKVKMRKTPKLSFVIDHSSEKVDRIENLIKKIKEND